LLRLTAFDANFATRYRESSFLRHPLVPDAVRRGISTRCSISTLAGNATVATSPTSNAARRNGTDSISDDQLRRLLGADRHRVISLASLERVRVTFNSTARQRNFDKMVNESFKHSDYRQLT